MRIRTVCAGVFALGLLAGPASADAFSDLVSLPSFYSDAGMKTMKPMAGFKKGLAGCASEGSGHDDEDVQ